MNVIYILDPNTVGGATKSFVEIVTILKKEYNVNPYVCTGGYTELNEYLKKNDINAFDDGHIATMQVYANNETLKWKHKLKRTYKYRTQNAVERIERNIPLDEIDLIHTNSARNDIGCVLSKKKSIPHIMHIREFGVEFEDCEFLRDNYYKFINRGTTRFLTVSNAVRDSWIKKGLDSNKVKTVYNGIDGSDVNRASFINSDVLKMIVAGGVISAKGQHQIIEAMALLPESIKHKLYLDIYGWGTKKYIDDILDRAKDLKLEKQIVYKGSVDSIHGLLSDYQIGFTCSKAEGFGRVTAEYMHAGLGVIVSDTGANKELIQHEKNGLVYKWNNYESLAEQIERFYNDRQLLSLCGGNAFRDAKEKYTVDNNVKNIYEHYKKVLEL